MDQFDGKEALQQYTGMRHCHCVFGNTQEDPPAWCNCAAGTVVMALEDSIIHLSVTETGLNLGQKLQKDLSAQSYL